MHLIESLYINCPRVAHYQNGAITKETAANMDVCFADDTGKDGDNKVALTISNNNVYDGYIGAGFPTDLVKTFIGVRKKDSNEVRLRQRKA